MPPSLATSQYPPPSGVAARPTTGRLSGFPPIEPKNWAFPKLKIPPSEAASQYEDSGGAGGGGDGPPGTPPDPLKASTRSEEGARSRPSPTDGVGKWFASPPSGSCCTVAPVAGSML